MVKVERNINRRLNGGNDKFGRKMKDIRKIEWIELSGDGIKSEPPRLIYLRDEKQGYFSNIILPVLVKCLEEVFDLASSL